MTTLVTLSDADITTRLEAVKVVLARITAVPEAKVVRDQAEALRYAAKQAGLSADVQNLAAEMRVRAERRMGELLRETDRHKGGDPERLSSDPTGAYPPTLCDLGVTRDESSTWQQVASIPEPEFEQAIEERKAEGTPITTTGLVSLAKERAQREQAMSDAMVAMTPDPDGAIERAKLVKLFGKGSQQLVDLMALDLEVIVPGFDRTRQLLTASLITQARAWLDRLEATMEHCQHIRVIGE